MQVNTVPHTVYGKACYFSVADSNSYMEYCCAEVNIWPN